MAETLILIAVFGVLAWLADRWTEWARRQWTGCRSPRAERYLAPNASEVAA